MQSLFSNALCNVLSQHLCLSASRRQTLSWLVFLFLRQGSVCLWRLAAHVESQATLASVQRRFYRFFQFVHLDGAMVARIIVALLGLEGKSWTLTIDRTNWFLGRNTINILMIAVDWHGIGIPLMWTLLPTRGNSDTPTRLMLLDHLIKIFPNMTIESLSGDREFVGTAWMETLTLRNIPFVLRIKDSQIIRRDNFTSKPAYTLARRLKPGRSLILKGTCRLCDDTDVPPLSIVMKRLKNNDLLVLATNARPKAALARYRERWGIECLFANLKSRGFNLEQTHLTIHAKLETLIALLAIAMALAAKAANNRKTTIPLKAHGRKATSLFALGLKTFCKAIATPNIAKTKQFISDLIAQSNNSKSVIRGQT